MKIEHVLSKYQAWVKGALGDKHSSLLFPGTVRKVTTVTPRSSLLLPLIYNCTKITTIHKLICMKYKDTQTY